MRLKPAYRWTWNFVIGLCIGFLLVILQAPFSKRKCIYLENEKIIKRYSKLRDLRSNMNENKVNHDYLHSSNSNTNIDITRKQSKYQKLTGGLIRPRYYSTELGMKDKLIVLVLSDINSIKSFGVAINKTLNHYVNKLIFFVDGVSSKKFNLDLSVVSFKDSRPSLKVFRIISYIIEHYVDFYDYFLFVTDKSYINGPYLLSLLQRISISHSIHIGSPSEDGNKYCSVDSGIILSRDIVQNLRSKLTWCIKNIHSSSVDVILHQCIMLASHQPCNLIYKDKFHSAPIKVGTSSYEASSTREIEKSFIISNISDSSEIYQIHIYVLQKLVHRNSKHLSNLRKEIHSMKEHTLEAYPIWPIGSSFPLWSSTRFDLLRWDLFNSTTVFMPNDFHALKPIKDIDLADLWAVTNSSINHLFTKKEYSMYKFKQLSYGYRRFDPTRGVDYMLNLICTSRTGREIPIRVEAFRGLTTAEVVPMPYVTDNKIIIILINVHEREVAAASGFLERMENKRLAKQVSIEFSLLYEGGSFDLDPFQPLKREITKFSETHYSDESRAKWRELNVSKRPTTVSLVDLAIRKLPNNVLVMVVNPSAKFDIGFLNNVRMNTIQGWQVYSAIPFALYHPSVRKINSDVVSRSEGKFDEFDYSYLSFYASDYKAVRKLSKYVPVASTEKDLIKISGKTSTTLYALFIKHSNLHLMRSVEPALLTEFAPVKCGIQSSPDCHTKQSFAYGPRSFLSQIFLSFSEDGGSHIDQSS